MRPRTDVCSLKQNGIEVEVYRRGRNLYANVWQGAEMIEHKTFTGMNAYGNALEWAKQRVTPTPTREDE